ncbi:MAG: HEAT repeat domain-containing protein [Planctomycetes bacterium]|nr:HEAT repeat domain-containing protein [Planctomycetota bacterium]
MAVFGKSGSLALLQRVRNQDFRTPDELEGLLTRIDLYTDLKAAEIAWMAGHPRREVRQFGRRKLLALSDRQQGIVELLFGELEGKTDAIGTEILELASRIDAGAVYRALGRRLASRQPEQRLAGLALIAAHADWRDYLAPLKTALRDPDVRIRLKVVQVLCTDPAMAAVRLLLRRLLYDEDEEVRRLVIGALAQHPEPDLVEPFLERLPLEGAREQAQMIRALTRLARDPAARIQERLLPLLADENAQVRDAAVKLLREIPDRREVIRSYVRFTHGLAHWLRERSYAMFLQIGADVLEPVLALMEDPDPDIRVGAMMLATKSRSERAIGGLRRCLVTSPEWWVRVLAVECLASFPEPEVIALLTKQVENADLRPAVVSALGKMKRSRTLPALLPCLGDAQTTVRMMALDALAELRFPEVADAVARVALSDEDHAVREKAELILEGLGSVGTSRLEAVREMQERRERERISHIVLELEMENPTLETALWSGRRAAS